MARELGLGITPWSPLKSGVLSGKYTRANVATAQKDRGAFVEHALTEKAFAVVDVMEEIAQTHASTVARVALAWVRLQPGVTSTIIGARRLAQLEDNVQSLDVQLTAGELVRLDELTKPTFGFPQSMEPLYASIHTGGTTVNGVYAPRTPYGVGLGEQPY